MTNDIHGAGTKEKKAAQKIFRLRVDLHNAIVKKMKWLGFCTAASVVEVFKRRYLWDYHNVETSRSLTASQLKDAIEMLKSVDRDAMTNSILMYYTKFKSSKELVKSTDKQRNKIKAICTKALKLKPEGLSKYASDTLGRAVYVNKYHWLDVSIAEAHELIQRLEKWEAKVLTNGRK